MANAIVTLRIMPVSPEADLKKIETGALEKIKAHAGETETKIEVKPIAFGLKAVQIIFVVDEAKGGTDALEEEIKTIEGVQSVEVTDVRRAIG